MKQDIDRQFEQIKEQEKKAKKEEDQKKRNETKNSWWYEKNICFLEKIKYNRLLVCGSKMFR